MATCGPTTTILLNQRKNFFIGNRVHIADNHKLLFGFDQPRQKLAKEGKRRVGNNDVGLVAQLLDFIAAKIAVAFQISQVQIVHVDFAVSRLSLVSVKILPFLAVLTSSIFRFRFQREWVDSRLYFLLSAA